MDKVFGLAFWLLLLTGTVSTCKAQTQPRQLPTIIEPLHYRFELTVYNDRLNESKGLSIMWITPWSPTNTTVLHCPRLLAIEKPIKIYENGTDVDIYKSHKFLGDGTDKLEIYTNVTLAREKKYIIEMHFLIKAEQDVLAIGSYVSEDIRRSFITTQMELINARQLFPCYDEPKWRVPVELVLFISSSYNATSNGDIKSNRIINDESRRIAYEETPMMPINKINIVISQLPKVTNELNGKNFSIQARREVLDNIDFAMDIARTGFEELEAYFNVSYRMSKMDVVVLTEYKHESTSGWGIVIYREEMFTSNTNHTPTMLYQKIVNQISYENANIWFGNEVHPSSWGDIWLKEGLSAFFSYLLTDKLLNWNTLEYFAVDSMQKIMNTEPYKNIQSLSPTWKTADEIKAINLEIQRIKGAAILRMFYHIIGEEAFQKGVQNYLTNSYAGLVGIEYFFDQFQRAIDGTNILPTGMTVRKFFYRWIDYSSYPLLTIRRPTTTSIKVEQKKYCIDVPEICYGAWWIPMNIVGSNNINFNISSPKIWINPDYGETEITINSSDEWYLFNPQYTGYYRVLYDKDNWVGLTKYLNSYNYSQIHPLNRAQLLSDALELARTGRMDYYLTMNLLTYLQQETDHIPWTAAKSGIMFLKHHMEHSKQHNKLMRVLSSFIKKYYDLVTLRSDLEKSHVTKIRKTTAVELAYEVELESCISDIDKLSSEHLSPYCNDCHRMLDPDIRAQVYCHGLKVKHIDFDNMWNKYLKIDLASEESIFLDAMGCSSVDEDKHRYLQKSIADGFEVKRHNRHRILNSVIKSGSSGRNMTLNFIIDNFVQMQSKFQSSTDVDSIIITLADYINSDEEINKFAMFAQTHNGSFTFGQRQEISRAMQKLDEIKKWKMFLMKDVEIWVKAYSRSSTISIYLPTLVVAFLTTLFLHI